jgi:hypothetical protein
MDEANRIIFIRQEVKYNYDYGYGCDPNFLLLPMNRLVFNWIRITPLY